MPNLIDCPACGRKLRVPETLVGTPVKCPTCGQTFTAPSEPSPFPAQVATPPPLPVDGPPPLPEVPPPADAAPPPSAAAATDAKVCPYCSQNLRLDATRCLFCGIDLTRPLSEQPEPMEWVANVSGARSRRRDSEPHRGNFILTLGILSFLLPFVGLPLGITAWAMGYKDLKKMRSDEMDAQGADLTQGGMICGIIGTLLQAIIYGCCGFCILGTAAGSVQRPAPPPPAQTVPVTPDPVEE